MEYDCTSCSGTGQQSVPKAEVDSSGNPMIVFEITTCIVCSGNGKVHVL